MQRLEAGSPNADCDGCGVAWNASILWHSVLGGKMGGQMRAAASQSVEHWLYSLPAGPLACF